MIGAPGFYPSANGFARLVSGADGATIRTFVGNPGQNMGFAISRMGDVNLDGVDDFAIASGGTMVSGYDYGSTTHIFSGANGAQLAVLTGPTQTWGFGAAIRGDVDLTGDGRPELLVGSPMSRHRRSVQPGVVRAYSFVPGLSSYGAGLDGCSGPELQTAAGAPTVGNANFALGCTNAPPHNLGLCLLSNAQDPNGSDPFSIDVPLFVDLFSATEIYAFDMPSDNFGHASVPAPIPAVPGLAGHHYYAQTLWAWPSSSLHPVDFRAERVEWSRNHSVALREDWECSDSAAVHRPSENPNIPERAERERARLTREP